MTRMEVSQLGGEEVRRTKEEPRVDVRPSLIIAAFVILILADLTWAKTGPKGVIRILCIGESYYPETILPLIVASDPKIEYNPLPANVDEATFTFGGVMALRRFVRIYIPRRYEDFLARYDVVILSDFPAIFLEIDHMRWFEQAVREEGAGLGKYELNYGISGAAYPLDPWRASPVYPAFPADLPNLLLPGRAWLGGVRVKRDNPMVDLPGVDRYLLFGPGIFGLEVPRPGSETIAWWRGTDLAAIIIWKYGSGRAASTVAGLDWMDGSCNNPWGPAAREWDFYPDFFLNQFYWLASEEIPPDPFLINTIRKGLRDLRIRTQLVLSVVAFVETFGASGNALEGDLDQISKLRSEAKDLYLGQEYLRCMDTIETCLALMTATEQRSLNLKDQALLWIYAIQWFVVSGTALGCGFVVYTLMIRRRMYTEVSVTRLATRAADLTEMGW